MKYILLINNNPATLEAMTDNERDQVMAQVGELIAELEASGELVGGEALAAAAHTKTVRVVNGVPAATDGPFVEAKEYLAGYLILDCADIDRAVDIAGRWPDARFGAMEVRPIIGSFETPES